MIAAALTVLLLGPCLGMVLVAWAGASLHGWLGRRRRAIEAAHAEADALAPVIPVVVIPGPRAPRATSPTATTAAG